MEAQNAIYLDKEMGGKGRQFKSRFLVPGLVKYDYGVCLLTKENADKFIQGFIGCPVVINHQDVTDANAKDVSVGNIFSVWFDEKDGYYWCNGIITDKHAIELIDKGYSVSCQYTITEYSDNVSGALHNGNPYDKIIENGKPEHLAIVDNPRYEGAIIAVNAILAQNEDKWITIHPNGEENKGKHLLIKDGESVEDAMHRNGWYKKRQAKDEKNSDENIKSKIQKSIEQSKKTAKNPKFYDGFDVVVKDGIVKVEKDGKLSKTGFKYDEGATDDTGEDWNTGALGNLIQKWNAENPKQTDKEEKGEQTLDDKIKEHENKIPRAYKRNTKTKALWLYKNNYITRTEFEKVQTASNSFIDQFKDTLYTALAEGIANRLGELKASNEDKREPKDWITINGNHIPVYTTKEEAVKKFLEEKGEENTETNKEKKQTNTHKNILDIEEKNRYLDYEKGTVFDKNGNIIKELTSNNREEIDLNGKNLDFLNDAILTHNHPDGSPLSYSDIATGFVDVKLAELRATTIQGATYSLKPNDDYTREKAIEFATKYKEVPLEAAKAFRDLCKEEIKKGTLDIDFLKSNMDNLFKVYAWKQAEEFLEKNALKYGFDYKKEE